MNKSICFIATILVLAIGGKAQNTFPATGPVGIGTISPNTKSLLEVGSTTKGVLFPRMTMAQRNAIGAPPVGLLIFQTDSTSGFYYYTGSAWKAVTTTPGANKTLSNLTSPTAVSQNLLPGITGTRDLGSPSRQWRDGNFNGTVYANGASTGVGVLGDGSTYGVYGNSNNIGVYGVGSASNSSYGVYGNSGYIGVYGLGGAYGIYGSSTDGYGVSGVSTNNYGLYGSGYDGSVAYGSHIGAYGAGTAYGVYGSGGTYGVYGDGGAYGVFGNSGTNGAHGVEAYSAAGVGLYATTGDNTAYWAGYFVGDVYSSTGVFTGSDARIKQNIRDFTSAMDIINQLHPRQYEFRSDGDYKSMNFARGTHFGLIAQDLEKVLPNLVKNSKLEVPVIGKPGSPVANKAEAHQQAKTIDTKAVNYTELIPIIIKGMQELSKENAELREQVSEIRSTSSAGAQNGKTAILTGASIEQNVPNPFDHTTTIRYLLPDKFSNAQIVVNDETGKVLKQLNISGSGKGVVNLDASALSSGSYNYSLIINGKLIATKQMVLAK
jgi:hypothetical protein